MYRKKKSSSLYRRARVNTEGGIYINNLTIIGDPNIKNIGTQFNEKDLKRKDVASSGCSTREGVLTDELDEKCFTEGIDISHHKCINWTELSPDSSGKTFIIAKATEGATHQDSKFFENWSNMSDLGFQSGAYHFLRFGTSTPRAQMDNFVTQLRKAGGWTNESIIALSVNVEQNPDLVRSVTEECVTYLRDEEGVIPFIYTRQNIWDTQVTCTPEIVKECPLWIARWRAKQPAPNELPRGWDKWTIWHYFDKGTVPGIEGYVHLDKMKLYPKEKV